MKERFNLFMSQLSDTNSTLDSLTDFEKVASNVNKISLKLCQLNYLLGRNDLDVAIGEVFGENPKAFSVLDVLVAVRGDKRVLNRFNLPVGIVSYFSSIEGICEYIKATGLEDVFKSRKINNLVDYVFGVEVGLDTNARKNRGGAVMESCVASLLDDAGISYREQVVSTEFDHLSSLGEDLKRFDFVIETECKTYFIETNYYNGGGSKLNEIARSYADIAPKINSCPSYEFVWITDGRGWHSAKSKLEKAFNVIPSIYNLTTLSDFVAMLQRE